MPVRRVPNAAPIQSANSADGKKVILLGLDGADWRFLEPMIANGLTPTIARLLGEGAAGILKTDVAHSPISWTTIATGRPAAVHGMTEQVQFDQGEHWRATQYEPREIKVRRIWEIAREQKRTIAVYDYYFRRARPAGAWGWMPQMPIRKPTDLPEGLTVEGCPVPENVQWLNDFYTEACLLGRRATDLTVILVRDTDDAQHRGALFWLEKWHPELFADDPHMPRIEEFDEVTETWIKVDRAIGYLLGNLPDSSHLVICSDHGFGPPATFKAKAQIGLCGLDALGLDRRRLDEHRFSRFDTPFGKLNVIKFEKDVSLPLAHFKGRSKAEELSVSLERLLICGDSASGGRWMDEAEARLKDRLGPDMEMLEVKRIGSFGLWISPRIESMESYVIKPMAAPEQCAVNFSPTTGNHSKGDEGIVLIAGPGVEPGARIRGANLIDIAPTVLHLMGLPVARDMEGRVLTEAFRAEYLHMSARMKPRPCNEIRSA